MATVAVAGRIKGKLYWGVTTADGDAPYGGVELGSVRNMVWAPVPNIGRIRAEEWGGQTAGKIYNGENVVFSAMLREWNNNAIAEIFPNTVTSAGSDEGVKYDVTDNSGARAGTLLAVNTLLFVPQKPTVHRSILLYACTPNIEEAAQILFNRGTEFGIPVVFDGEPDKNGLVYQWDLLANLTEPPGA